MVAKVKSSYKITNWSEYNESLVRRGDVTFWFSDDVIASWEHANDEPKVGHPFVYSGHDADQVDGLLEQADGSIEAFYGDGAYDQWKVYKTLAKDEIQPIIPPRKNAKIKQHGNAVGPPLPRDEAIREIRGGGRQS